MAAHWAVAGNDRVTVVCGSCGVRQTVPRASLPGSCVWCGAYIPGETTTTEKVALGCAAVSIVVVVAYVVYLAIVVARNFG